MTWNAENALRIAMPSPRGSRLVPSSLQFQDVTHARIIINTKTRTFKSIFMFETLRKRDGHNFKEVPDVLGGTRDSLWREDA